MWSILVKAKRYLVAYGSNDNKNITANINFNKKQINIFDTSKNMRGSLYHELVHAVLAESKTPELTNDEELVSHLAECIYDIHMQDIEYLALKVITSFKYFESDCCGSVERNGIHTQVKDRLRELMTDI